MFKFEQIEIENNDLYSEKQELEKRIIELTNNFKDEQKNLKKQIKELKKQLKDQDLAEEILLKQSEILSILKK